MEISPETSKSTTVFPSKSTSIKSPAITPPTSPLGIFSRTSTPKSTSANPKSPKTAAPPPGSKMSLLPKRSQTKSPPKPKGSNVEQKPQQPDGTTATTKKLLNVRHSTDLNIKPKPNFSLTSPRLAQRNRSKSNLDKKSVTCVTPPPKTFPAKSRPSCVLGTSNPSSSVTIAKTSFHKPGFIPSSVSRSIPQSLKLQMNSIMQTFKKEKRKLGEQQTTVMSRYNDILELQQKIQKSGGRDTPIDRLELVAFVPTADVSKFITNSSASNDTLRSPQSLTTNRTSVNSVEFANRQAIDFIQFEMHQMNEKNIQMAKKFIVDIEQCKAVRNNLAIVLDNNIYLCTPHFRSMISPKW